ncbi:hypothetical protein [Acuticoccus sp.]|uniref:hypothetical protein n=1 Tax=Acuticoccus sp. TaxID=1904378 RepID=UPI003B52C898
MNDLDIKTITIGRSASRSASRLTQGDVDPLIGFSFSSVLNLKLQDVAKDAKVTLPMADHGLELYGNAALATTEWAQDDPKAVECFPRVAKGEFAAVVGPSDCGSSSGMRLATGLTSPGRTRRGGRRRHHGTPSIMGTAVGNPWLFPWRATLDTMLLPLEIVRPHRRRRPVPKHRRAHREKAEALLVPVCSGFGMRYPCPLSGSMEQRANLRGALIHDPALLRLNEPFGALDALPCERVGASCSTSTASVGSPRSSSRTVWRGDPPVEVDELALVGRARAQQAHRRRVGRPEGRRASVGELLDDLDRGRGGRVLGP